MILGHGIPLVHFEQELVRPLVAHTRTIGVEVPHDALAPGVEQTADRFRVRVATGGREDLLDMDLVVRGAAASRIRRGLIWRQGRWPPMRAAASR